MPGGQASHKGNANKPNVNASGVIGEAADSSLNPEEILPEAMTTNAVHRAEEAVSNPSAVERPHPEEEDQS